MARGSGSIRLLALLALASLSLAFLAQAPKQAALRGRARRSADSPRLEPGRFCLAALASQAPRLSLRARGGDFAVIRFRIPGIDDLSQLPRVITGVVLLLLIYNRATATASEVDGFRQAQGKPST